MEDNLHFTIFDKTISVQSFVEASDSFSFIRDRSGLGANKMPLPAIYRRSEVVGHFSYNGRIWSAPSKDWTPDSAPIYDNRAA